VPPVKKKLYRDPQNSMIGGVCSGVAHYLNLDPTVVRLATVLLTVLSVSTVAIVYIVLWIVVPEARTPLERMQMLGEAPTMENIARTVTDNYKEENGAAPQPAATGFGATLANIFGICAKVLIIIGLIIGIPVLIGLALGLLGCLFALIMFCTGMGEAMFGGTVPEWYAEAGNIPLWGVLCGIGWILVFAIPIYILVVLGLKKNKAHFSKSTRLTMIIVWILGFILAGVSAGRIISLSEEQDRMSVFNEVTSDSGNVVAEQTDSIMANDTIEISNENRIEITSEGIHIQNDSVSINIGR
ncbi:MAG: PspC domain-containing protein, partial [Muribaculaceae bacterium]|nr:PspC domain-containing protein [Muribaculaceae bacterium]